jgi:hypothetical protein
VRWLRARGCRPSSPPRTLTPCPRAHSTRPSSSLYFAAWKGVLGDVQYALAPRTALAGGGVAGLGARGTEPVPGFGASALEKARSLGFQDIAAEIAAAAGAAVPPPLPIPQAAHAFS